MVCKHCSAQINEESNFCSECGAPVKITEECTASEAPEKKRLLFEALGSLWCAIVGLLCFGGMIYPLTFSVVSIILARISILKIRKHNFKGKLLALIGMAVSIVNIIFALVQIVSCLL